MRSWRPRCPLTTHGRPDAPDPARRAAGAPGRARGRGPRPDRPRARGRDRPRLRARRPGRRPRGRRSRSRSRSCPAGPRRPRRGTPDGCSSARSAGRPVVMLQGRFHLYEGNDPGLVIQPVLLFKAARRADRGPDQRRRRAGPVVRAGHADGHARPHQPDRAQPADRPERRRARPALPGPDRRLEPAAARAAARRRPRPRASASRRASTSA